MEFKKILRPFLPRKMYNERVMERENTRNEPIEYDEVLDLLSGLDEDTQIDTENRVFTLSYNETLTPEEAITQLETYMKPDEPSGFDDYSDTTAQIEVYEDDETRTTYLDIRNTIISYGGDGRAFMDAAGEPMTFEQWPTTRVSMAFDEDISRYLED